MNFDPPNMKLQPHLLLCLLWLCSNLSAQEVPVLVAETYDVINVEKPPTFPSGEPALYGFIHASFHPQPLPANTLLSGTKIVVSFTVDTLGNLGDFQILKDMGAGYGDELLRVLRSMPCWIPGEVNGKKVKTKMVLPLRIELK
jgi:protein TonB